MAVEKLQIGREIPDFFCKTARGDFWFHDFLSKDEAPPCTLLVSHPEDFSTGADMNEFTRRAVKMIGILPDLEDADTQSTISAISDDVINVGYPVILGTSCIRLPNVESHKQVGMMLQQIAQDASTTFETHRVAILIGPDRRILSMKSEPLGSKYSTFDGLVSMIDDALGAPSSRRLHTTGREWNCSSKWDVKLEPQEQVIVFGTPVSATVAIGLFILLI